MVISSDLLQSCKFCYKKVAVRSNFTLFKVLTQYIFCKVLHAEENGSDNFVKKKGSWEAISEMM